MGKVIDLRQWRIRQVFKKLRMDRPLGVCFTILQGQGKTHMIEEFKRLHPDMKIVTIEAHHAPDPVYH